MNKSNVIILTSGLSGSSVVSNLISKAGYWSGDQTCKKEDYDTHENETLVYLNNKILEKIEYQGSYTRIIDENSIKRVKEMDFLDNHDEYCTFIDRCNKSSPWIWKDPRLWITMPYWDRVLGDDIKYIHLDRSLMQRWISVNLRKQIQTYGYLRQYSEGINIIISKFLEDNNKQSLFMNYDDLIVQPEDTLDKISEFLGVSLTVDNLRSAYNYQLYKKNRGFSDFVKALSIYLKNYNERYR